MPILNSTLIIIASFVPLFFLTGMEGRLLAPLGIAFIVALCASTLVALTLTPVLCSYLLGGAESKEVKENHKAGSPVTRFLASGYARMLSWTLRHRWPVLGVTGVLLVLALVAFFSLGRSFLPPFNEGSFTINVATLPGISLEESDKIGRRGNSYSVGGEYCRLQISRSLQNHFTCVFGIYYLHSRHLVNGNYYCFVPGCLGVTSGIGIARIRRLLFVTRAG